MKKKNTKKINEDDIQENKEKLSKWNYVLIGLTGLLLITSLVQAFQINSIKDNGITTAAVGIDMDGWTENEKMNYEMHGTIPARYQSQGNSQPTMVGGC